MFMAVVLFAGGLVREQYLVKLLLRILSSNYFISQTLFICGAVLYAAHPNSYGIGMMILGAVSELHFHITCYYILQLNLYYLNWLHNQSPQFYSGDPWHIWDVEDLQVVPEEAEAAAQAGPRTQH